MGFMPPENLLAPHHSGVGGDSRRRATSDATVQPHSSGRPASDGRQEAFKMDAYSFGVTLQVTLLGEDGARLRTVKRKGKMMLPLTLTSLENTDLLTQLQLSDRLSQQAHNLLVDHLLPCEPSHRSCLADLTRHPFFLDELSCDDLDVHFGLAQRGSTSERTP